MGIKKSWSISPKKSKAPVAKVRKVPRLPENNMENRKRLMREYMDRNPGGTDAAAYDYALENVSA
tara:strand:+ start:2097 stop:2291 length:195 start_codon:yes stop_codon:yes gene_type:complete